MASKNSLTIFVFLILPCCFAFSQNVFTSYDIGDNQLSTEQFSRKQIFEQSNFIEYSTVIELGDIPNLINDGVLVTGIPNRDEIFSFRAHSIKSYPNGDYTYSADLFQIDSAQTITPEVWAFGNILLVKNGNDIFGEIKVGNDFYRIRSLTEGKSFLIKVDKSQYLDGPYCGNLGSTNSSDAAQNILNESILKNRNDFDCIIRVLVLYTEKTLELNPDILNYITI